MDIPISTLKAYEKTNLDLAIEAFARIEKPTVADLNCVKVQSDLKCKIDTYRLGAAEMKAQERRDEVHSSSRLAGFMEKAGDPRPSNRCDCHAVVSGKHALAAPMRAVMAWCMMRIDDPRNGCWLPQDWEDRPHMPKWLKNGVPHRRIHHPEYYTWIGRYINTDAINGLDDLIRALKMIRMRLQSGAVPPDVMPSTGLS